MSVTDTPAVERVHPPKAPYRIVNPVLGWLLSSPRRAGRVGKHLMLLHVTGRKTGRRLDIPVGYRQTEDGCLLVLTNARWRANLRGRPDVQITLRGVRRPAQAHLVEDPDTVAQVYQELIESIGHEKAGRRMGIRITVDRVPTRTELADAARREGLSLIYLDVSDRTP